MVSVPLLSPAAGAIRARMRPGGVIELVTVAGRSPNMGCLPHSRSLVLVRVSPHMPPEGDVAVGGTGVFVRMGVFVRARSGAGPGWGC